MASLPCPHTEKDTLARVVASTSHLSRSAYFLMDEPQCGSRWQSFLSLALVRFPASRQSYSSPYPLSDVPLPQTLASVDLGLSTTTRADL